MMAASPAILSLPPEVISQIKSSISIVSLNGVILELVKNSLDASCSKIDISVEYGRGGCTVEDDGLGIPPSEFHPDGGLAKLHRKSSLKIL
jgi:DNA mismatch repair protein MLH3